MKTIIIIILSAFTLTGHQDLADKSMQAYIKSSPLLWQQVVKDQKNIYENSKSNKDLFDLAMAEYGLVNATMADQNETLFDAYIEHLDEHLERLEEEGYRISEVKALMSAIAGLKIAYSPWKGMLLGPKAGYLIDEAVDKGGELPIVQKLYGNYLLFTPETWGGDPKKAVDAYQKSIDGFEAADQLDHWMYLDAMVWQSQALIKLGRKPEGVALLEKVLQVEPDFKWVSEVLLPKARK